MKSKLPASHLFRQFLLFALTLVFLLTVIRAAYALWQFSRIEVTDATVMPLFIQGLRFDLALVGIICIVPLILGGVLAMMTRTRPLAKFLITGFMLGGLLLVMLTELITPWFLETRGLRPDVQLLSSIEQPASIVKTLLAEQAVPLVVAAFLCLLILIAFWGRMEVRRFLRYRLSVPGALMLSSVGGVLCVLAISSSTNPAQFALSPADAAISTDVTINDLAMNSAYKLLYSLVWSSPPVVQATGEEMRSLP
ncbi:hypothetical protein ACUNV4_07270 [Granulosicoccus sp. 3-233]|uniref:hypothetical protein n=1 Tax=Granulosicoccus sp. 3-233 TaxID=3417969 RepID=UPI003D34A5B8